MLLGESKSESVALRQVRGSERVAQRHEVLVARGAVDRVAQVEARPDPGEAQGVRDGAQAYVRRMRRRDLDKPEDEAQDHSSTLCGLFWDATASFVPSLWRRAETTPIRDAPGTAL